jgi:hypothetical protein
VSSAWRERSFVALLETRTAPRENLVKEQKRQTIIQSPSPFVPGAAAAASPLTPDPTVAVLNERTMQTDVRPNYIHDDVHQGAIPARLLVSRRCRCEKFVQFPNNMANCCLAPEEGKSEHAWSWSPRRSILSHAALDTGREMMMMWCRRGEKTVETFPKRRRRDKQRQQLCVLLFGMQETFLLHAHEAAWKRRTHRPNYCQQPKPRSSAFPPSFSNQSINLFVPACRSRHVPAARAYYLITVARVCGEIFLFYVNRVFMGY